MRNKTLLIGIGVVIGLLLAAAGIVVAGGLNPSVGPGDAGSQMVTLEQIYERMATGAAVSKMASFTEPSAGPGAGTMHTLDEVLGAAPAVDGANGATAAEVASGKTFWGLTGGEWGVQTGTATGGDTYEAGVPKTGQTESYATGDDGDLEKGVAWPDPRFTDNGDGTVTDNLTGLIWLKNANCFGTQTWADALSAANTLNSGECGLTDSSAEGDWRLPNVRELQSLADYGRVNPALPSGHPFTDVQSDYYWTSTTYASFTSFAWDVGLYDGNVNADDKTTSSYYVWPVRGGDSGGGPAPTCTDAVKNGDEVDVDCGGSCPACATGKMCTVASGCQSGVCTAGVCQAPTCTDGVKNGTETDVDCGGSCSKCADNKLCFVSNDCVSLVCTAGVCQAPTCADGVKNGDETGVDCGGACSACP